MKLFGSIVSAVLLSGAAMAYACDKEKPYLMYGELNKVKSDSFSVTWCVNTWNRSGTAAAPGGPRCLRGSAADEREGVMGILSNHLSLGLPRQPAPTTRPSWVRPIMCIET